MRLLGSRRNAGCVTAAAGVALVAASGFAFVSCASAFSPNEDRPRPASSSPPSTPVPAPEGGDGAHVPTGAPEDVRQCESITRAWVGTLLDSGMDPDRWASQMSELTDPDAVQALNGVDRDALPPGPVTGVEVASQERACDALVTVAGPHRLVVSAAEGDDGRWVVTGWVDGQG